MADSRHCPGCLVSAALPAPGGKRLGTFVSSQLRSPSEHSEVNSTHRLLYHQNLVRASPVAQLVKNPPAMWETWVRSLGWEDPPGKGKATHSSILAQRIPWTVHGVAKSWTRLSDFHFQI